MNLKKQQRQHRALARRLKDVQAWKDIRMARAGLTEMDIKNLFPDSTRFWKEVRGELIQDAERSAAMAQQECDTLKKRLHVN